MFLGNSVWHLVTQSDLVSWIVLIILFAMSVLCWALVVGKIVIGTVKKRQLADTLARLEQAPSMDALVTIAGDVKDTVPGYAVHALVTLNNSCITKRDSLNDNDWAVIQEKSEQLVDMLLADEYAYSSVFSLSASVAPLLGLFGTIWGLIQAFVAISERQTADIVAIAPGIAQALITTLAGLMVAIPAFAMSIYIQSTTHQYERRVIQLIGTVQMKIRQFCSAKE